MVNNGSAQDNGLCLLPAAPFLFRVLSSCICSAPLVSFIWTKAGETDLQQFMCQRLISHSLMSCVILWSSSAPLGQLSRTHIFSVTDTYTLRPAHLNQNIVARLMFSRIPAFPSIWDLLLCPHVGFLYACSVTCIILIWQRIAQTNADKVSLKAKNWRNKQSADRCIFRYSAFKRRRLIFFQQLSTQFSRFLEGKGKFVVPKQLCSALKTQITLKL